MYDCNQIIEKIIIVIRFNEWCNNALYIYLLVCNAHDIIHALNQPIVFIIRIV